MAAFAFYVISNRTTYFNYTLWNSYLLTCIHLLSEFMAGLATCSSRKNTVFAHILMTTSGLVMTLHESLSGTVFLKPQKVTKG